MTADVALVGCGNIGRRHLEALAAIGRPLRVWAVEPDAAARAALTAPAHVTLTPLDGAAGLPATVDLAILATGAQARRAALEALLARCAPRALLLEKVLFPSRGDLDAVGAALADRAIPAFVNCGRRGFESYDALAGELAGRAGASARVRGAGWGLCSNAIHFIDIVERLTGETVIALDGGGLDPAPIPAKRAGCVEMTGALRGRLSGGGAIEIVCDAGAPAAPALEIAHDGALWRVEEGAGRLTRRGRDGAQTAAPFATRHVSGMPHLHAELIGGRSRLTPYADSARQHALLLDALRPAMGLSNAEDAPCPIS